jgi:hypothetical protein
MAGAPDMAPGADGQTVRLEVPARPGYVLLGRLALSAVCRLTPLADDAVADLKLAVTEAAGAFVGAAHEAPGASLATASPMEAAGQESGGKLAFLFHLDDSELAVEVSCSDGMMIADEERELSWAILAATVDVFESQDDRIRLVKSLDGGGD